MIDRLLRPLRALAAGFGPTLVIVLAAGESAAAERPVTFTRDIAPLVYERCVGCHRPGQVAPFSLLSFRDVSKRAELIRTVVEERSMPPWKAEPSSVHFADERRLSDDQVALVSRWVRDGAPEGDPADLPPAPTFATGWQLGEPDQVLSMAEPYTVPASGPDVYRCFVIPLDVPAGKYLEAVEYRPGNRRVVHHAVLTSLPHKVAQARLDAGDGKSFGSGLAPPGQLLPGPLAIWTPGMMPRAVPSEYSVEWPRGSDLVLQLHLHPSGKPETEQSSIGLHFTNRKPLGRLKLFVLSNNDIDIAPGASEHVVTATRTLREPVEVFGIFPHMHLIGRTVNISATLPDGKEQPLISINQWDFNWQNYYQYAAPVRLPAGTTLKGRWTYDNSAENPANPSQPPKRVRYGEQTSNEMAIVVFDLLPTVPEPHPATGSERSEDVSRHAAEVLRRADKDRNGKLCFDEIVAEVGDRATPAELKKRLAPFDRDGDHELSLPEIVEALKAMRRK